MSISKVFCISLIACAFVINVQARGLMSSVNIPITSDYIYNSNYVNLTATGTVLSGGNYTTQALWPTWTPDGNGTRSYADISIGNLSSTDSVSFVIFSSDEDDSGNTVYSDTRLWVHDPRTGEYLNVDDDHGPASSFGAKVTVGLGSFVTFRVSMYHSSSANPFFYIRILPASNTDVLDADYPTVRAGSSYGLVTVTNGN